MKIDTTQYQQENGRQATGYGLYGFVATWSGDHHTKHFGHGRNPQDAWRMIGTCLDPQKRVLERVELAWFVKH